MKVYITSIIVPFFMQQKTLHGLPQDHPCILQPWIIPDFMPAGFTGLFQPCDVGIQWILKLTGHNAGNALRSQRSMVRERVSCAALDFSILSNRRSQSLARVPNKPSDPLATSGRGGKRVRELAAVIEQHLSNSSAPPDGFVVATNGTLQAVSVSEVIKDDDTNSDRNDNDESSLYFEPVAEDIDP